MHAKRNAIRFTAIGGAIALALLTPVSVETSTPANETALVPVTVTDLCAAQGTCGPMINHACLQADGTWLLNAYCTSGCGGEGPPPWGGGRGGGGRP